MGFVQNTSVSAPASHSAPSNTFGKSSLNKPKIMDAYRRLPLYFEANEGQFRTPNGGSDEQVKFFSRGAGYSVFITSREAALILDQKQVRSKESGVRNSSRPPKGNPSTAKVIRMVLEGGNRKTQVEGLDQLSGTSNFLSGNPKNWRTQVPQYAKVRLKGIYPGVDMVYYGNGRKLEYDFAVQPGGNPSDIQLKFEGSEGLRVNKRGDLVIKARGGGGIKSADGLSAKRSFPTWYAELQGAYFCEGVLCIDGS